VAFFYQELDAGEPDLQPVVAESAVIRRWPGRLAS